MEQERRAVVIQAAIRRMSCRIMFAKMKKIKPQILASLKTRNLMFVDPCLAKCDEI
eukprot:Awhi_evm1s3534